MSDKVFRETMSGIGMARLKQEGAPVHPDDIDWECDCEHCQKRYKMQLKAWIEYEDKLK